MDAALGDDHGLVVAQSGDQLELCFAVDLERRQVAGVDADDLGLESDRPLQLVRVVSLHERLDTELACVGDQGGGARVVDVAQQDECGVRAGELELQ